MAIISCVSQLLGCAGHGKLLRDRAYTGSHAQALQSDTALNGFCLNGDPLNEKQLLTFHVQGSISAELQLHCSPKLWTSISHSDHCPDQTHASSRRRTSLSSCPDNPGPLPRCPGMPPFLSARENTRPPAECIWPGVPDCLSSLLACRTQEHKHCSRPVELHVLAGAGRCQRERGTSRGGARPGASPLRSYGPGREPPP